MARTRKKTAAASLNAAPKSSDQALFDDFLPHLIAKLRREGINVTRWRILAVLAMGDGITINEIIDRAMVQQSALSRALMRMEKENYVRRVLRREEARCVEVYLTDKGRTLFNSLNIVVRRREERLLEGFSPPGVEAAFNLIRRLSRNMRSRSSA